MLNCLLAINLVANGKRSIASMEDMSMNEKVDDAMYILIRDNPTSKRETIVMALEHLEGRRMLPPFGEMIRIVQYLVDDYCHNSLKS